jgi:hypothetical protein
VAAPARINQLALFILQLQGPFHFIVRAGLAPITACSLVRRTRFTRPLQRLSSIGRDYIQNGMIVNGSDLLMIERIYSNQSRQGLISENISDETTLFVRKQYQDLKFRH